MIDSSHGGRGVRSLLLACALLPVGLMAGCASSGEGVPEEAPAPVESLPPAPPADAGADADADANASADVRADAPAERLLVGVSDGEREVVFELNDGSAARSLYEQLPLSVDVSAYADDEMIFYPPQKLDVSDAPQAQGPAGTLGYFAPWGDVVMYYGACGPYRGLYELGEAVSGAEHIDALSGTIEVAPVDAA